MKLALDRPGSHRSLGRTQSNLNVCIQKPIQRSHLSELTCSDIFFDNEGLIEQIQEYKGLIERLREIHESNST